jgi:uncharacterized lipoprotein YmbA
MNCRKLFNFKVLLLIVSVSLLNSCILSPKPFRSVSYYDIGLPAAINAKGPFVIFSRFSINGPYRTKMVFRAANNQLIINEYSKWAQNPDVMLSRYMTLAFRAKPKFDNEKPYTVTVSILTFEAEESTGNAVLIVEYSILNALKGNSKSFTKTFKIKMENMNSYSFSVAMAKNAANFADQLKQDMLSMK